MSKIRLLTHIADVDGLFPVILSQLVFGEIEYDLLQVDEVDDKVKEILPNIEQYDQVYITDLNISRELAEVIDQNPNYQKKITIIDHHIGKIDMNDFSFITVIDQDEQRNKQSATSLFYQYLIKYYDIPILHKSCITTLVEYIRKVDTWTWQDDSKSMWISRLKDIFGPDYFLEHYLEYVKTHDNFEYEQRDIYLLEVEDIRIQNYIEKVKDEIIPVRIDGYRVGILFSDQYASDVGNALATMYQDTYDFIAMIKMRTGKVSYRAVKDNVDLTLFAQKYGGNGHKHAAGSRIPEFIREKIIQMIYPESEIL